jgi:hypothetical protein
LDQSTEPVFDLLAEITQRCPQLGHDLLSLGRIFRLGEPGHDFP